LKRLPALAIVGRPNVGKSTLFNRLALDLRLIDTAGYEDAATGIEVRMRAQTERALLDADVCIFLIDGREGVTALDQRFAELLRRSGRPVSRRRPAAAPASPAGGGKAAGNRSNPAAAAGNRRRG